VPKLWTETIEEHRRAVRDATLDTTAALVAERGLASVTMSQIAAATGIGRATLYKYFPDVDAILTALHQRQVERHMEQLATVRDQTSDGAGGRLKAVLTAYAIITHQRPHGTEFAAAVHRGEHLSTAQQHLLGFFEDLIADAVSTGEVRDDVPPTELASYCLHALQAASSLPSEAAVHRLVTITLAGLRLPL
jgi:AcrR family transcriptional regulator